MLTEEALIFLFALGAVGLIVLGTLELLWPTRPKHPVRRAVPAPPQVQTPEPRRWRSDRPRHTARGPERSPYVRRAKPAEPLPPRPVSEPPFTLASLIRPPQPESVPAAFQSLPAEPAALEPPPMEVPAVEQPALPQPAPAEPVAMEPVALEPVALQPVATEPTLLDDALTELADLPPDEPEPVLRTASAETVDRCFELCQERRYGDVVTIAVAALGDTAPPARRPADNHEAAALWSVLALAQQALGDHAAARGALEAAIETAPDAERPTYQRQLAALALRVAEELIAGAGANATPESESRVTDLRDALTWIECGRALTPADAGLRALAATAEGRLWPAYEQVVLALVQRREFRAARRLLREALDHPRVPPARAEAFRELFSGTFSGEIGQLTAQAIRSMQDADEREALGALERAERLLDTLHEAVLSPERREEVDQRLWWGYNKLGVRRVQSREFEGAIEPLVRALRLAGTAAGRQSETRGTLVQAFEGWTETRALAVREIAHSGDREAALVQSDKVWSRLRAALGEGLSERDLAAAFARAQQMFEEIGREQERARRTRRSRWGRCSTRRRRGLRRRPPSSSRARGSPTPSSPRAPTPSRAGCSPSASAPATTSSSGCPTASSGTSSTSPSPRSAPSPSPPTAATRPSSSSTCCASPTPRL